MASAPAAAPQPDTPSSDYKAMAPHCTMVAAILGGKPTMEDAGERFLPKYPKESVLNYARRLKLAPFTNVYEDVITNLAAKPFSDKVKIDDGAGADIEALAEDIDGRGNNLHVFASEVFFGAINNAVDWILVDYPEMRPGATLADERRIGARPYWVRIPAERVLAVETASINGRESVVHARIREDRAQRDGYDEITVRRVREFNRTPQLDGDGRTIGYAPASYILWEYRSAEGNSPAAWVKVAEGPVTIGEIPMVPVIVGRRLENSWRFDPPMRAVADLQIKHYQRESGLDHAVDLTAFPMLAANGVNLRDESGKTISIEVGPHAVLSAPPYGDNGTHGEWRYIEPAGSSLEFMSTEIDKIEKRMRDLGQQPLSATAGITVVTAALSSQKVSSRAEAWAWALKDALERAFQLTAKWLGQSASPTVYVKTKFAIGLGDDNAPNTVLSMRKAGDLSQETLWEEQQRLGVLGPEFDPVQEQDRLAREAPDPDDEDEIEAAQTPPANDGLAA